MNQVLMQASRGFSLVMGGMRLYVSSYKVTGVCSITEQACSDGQGAVTSAFPKGTRLELQGFVIPGADVGGMIGMLAAYLQYGTLQNLQIGKVTYPSARLCGYTIGEGGDQTTFLLRFHVEEMPVAGAVEI